MVSTIMSDLYNLPFSSGFSLMSVMAFAVIVHAKKLTQNRISSMWFASRHISWPKPRESNIWVMVSAMFGNFVLKLETNFKGPALQAVGLSVGCK